MKMYIVRGRHGELHLTRSEDTAMDLWAETNGYSSFEDFWEDFDGHIESSTTEHRTNWFLDEGGQVDYISEE